MNKRLYIYGCHHMIKGLKKDKELWDIFTRKEEYSPLLLDKNERFPYYLSTNRNIFDPIVSKFIKENTLVTKYPGNKNFAVCLTHDIDGIYHSKIGRFIEIGKLLKNKKCIEPFKVPFYNLSKNLNPFWNFEFIMELEHKYGAKSSFYFLALDKGNLGFNYNIENLERELKYIVDNGWEVGLHGGYDAYNSLSELKREKQKLENALGDEVIGYRNHVLKFKVPNTWELLAKSGFKYDTTYGYADCAGFRNGMCHPFKPFNLETGNEINIVEIPLTIMDSSLFDYMRLDMKNAWEIIKLLIDSVEKNNGIMTILWHNTYFSGELLKMYENILKYCYNKNAWITCSSEIYEWTQESGFLELDS